MKDEAVAKAEQILTQFPDSYSPSNLHVVMAVAAALKVENDAAYVRGLERGRDIAYDYENVDVTEWETKYGDRLSYEAIQAEIDKAKAV